MVDMPAGDFMIGENEKDNIANPTERPAHRVRGSAAQTFDVVRFPVTVGEFRSFKPDHAADEPDDLPVVKVNWHDAQAYCLWLTEKSGRVYRLPSEAEWEYACRGGSRAVFAFGDEITTELANFLYDESGQVIGPGKRTPVGNYTANAFGLHDFHGNVCEWVADNWHPNYAGAPNDAVERGSRTER